ncbi:MAG TPA: hypothetical protein VI643_05595 [Planctomycetota bacterium]|nr:hypothetical protein [Planctomycetota bacterium]
MNGTARAMLWATLPLLGGSVAAQDKSGWIDQIKRFCADPKPGDAAGLRDTLASVKNPSLQHVLYAFRAILLQAQVEPWKAGNTSAQAVIKYLDEAGPMLGGSVDHAKGLGDAMAAGSDAGRLIAMAHLEHLLESGSKPDKLDDLLKKLKLKPGGGDTYLPAEFDEVPGLKRLSDAGIGGELEKRSAKTFEGDYLRVVGMLRSMEKDPSLVQKIKSTLGGLKANAPEHCEALLDALKPYGTCTSCRGSRRVSCTMCSGQGEVEMLCPHCKGTGKIKLKDLGGSDVVKGRAAGSGASVRTPSGEIVSVGADETICPTCIYQARKKKQKCAFCEGAKTVACQRCKWVKMTLDSLAKTEPCKNCAGKGFGFAKILSPCAFCKAVGLFLILNHAQSATIGPKE